MIENNFLLISVSKMFSKVLEMKKLLWPVLVFLSVFHVANPLSRRSLVVPPTSPTRHQLISGIGIPLELEDEAITMGLVLKAQYYLVRFIS